FVGHLVANGIKGFGSDTARQLIPDLEIGSALAERRRADPEQLHELINLLLDEKPLRDGQRLALLSERMSEVDTMEAFVRGSFGSTTTPPTSDKGNALKGYAMSAW